MKLSTKPKFIIHGERDELISLKAVREFYARLQEPKEFVEIDRANHLFDGQASEVGDALEESAVGLLMQDAVIVVGHAHRRRQGAERRAEDRPPGRDGRGGHRRSRCAACPAFDPRDVDDVIMGCAMPEAEQGLNVARIASLRAGVPVDASAVTMNRFCASGLQAIASAPSTSCAASPTS